MRFTPALLFGLAAANNSYFQKRQGDGIAGVFAILKPMVEQLDSLVNAYTGGPGADVVAQSKKIAAQVKTSTGTVNAVPGPLDISAASSLVAPVQDFTTSLEKTIDDLIAHKQLAVSSGIGGTVYSNLEEQLAGATALATAIKSKMPSTLAATADELSGKILDALNKGISAFKDSAGSGAGAGAGAAGASPAGGASTSTSGSAGGAGASLGPVGSSYSGAGASSGASSSGMSSMGGASMGGASGSYDAAAPQVTSARGSSPAVFTGAGASFKPASVFGLVAVAAAVFAL